MNPLRLAGRGLLGLAAGATVVLTAMVAGQPTGPSPLNPPPNGPRRADTTWHALTNATVHVRPGETIEHGTVVIRGGRIEAVLRGQGGKPAAPPAGAQPWDCTGLHIYPGFIDAYLEVDAPPPDPNQPGTHWNPRVTPQRSALDGAGLDAAAAEGLRRLGFTAAAISPRGGVFRGRSAVVSLAKAAEDMSADRPPVYAPNAYHSIAFDLGRTSGIRPVGGRDAPDVMRWSSYPGSLMGAIALIRQTLIDQEWQEQVREAGQPLAYNAIDTLSPAWARNAPDRTTVTAKIGEAGSRDPIPLLFDCDDELDALRAAKIAREFKRSAILLGSGYEFRRLEAIRADGLPIVLPLRYPRTPDVSTIGKAEGVDLRELMTWEQAPTNARRLDAAGVKVALTTAKLRNRTEFSENLTKAIKHGLKPERALAMLTTQPAEILGVSDRLGTIEPGKIANLVVADGDLFEAWSRRPEPAPEAGRGPGMRPRDGSRGRAPAAGEGQQPGGREGQPEVRAEVPGGAGAESVTPERAERDDEARDTRRPRVRDVWIDGIRHEINAAPEVKLAGAWTVTVEGGTEPVRLTIDDRNAITVQMGEKRTRARSVSVEDRRITFQIDGTELGHSGVTLISGVVERDAMHGTGLDHMGNPFRWSAQRSGAGPEPPIRSVEGPADPGFSGEWHVVEIDGVKQEAEWPATPRMRIDGRLVEVTMGEAKVEGEEVAIAGNRIDFAIDGAVVGADGMIRVRGTRDGDRITGVAHSPDGEAHDFAAVRKAPPERRQAQRESRAGRGSAGATPRRDPEQVEREQIASIPEALGYPFGPYMLGGLPAQGNVLFQHATVWTSGPKGVIRDGAVYISQGKIQFVGTEREWQSWIANKRIADLQTVDCTGKHITPGLIDCHSHTGISRGVNESGQAVTAEVRIQDVTDPNAISWYRQLAAGVTTVNQLHGSANAIGGQNCVTKNRWGVAHPDQMHFEGAKPGIKFALGENPKWSNAGDRSNNRYPQTRMGVEAIIRDRFTAAREYLRQRDEATKGRNGGLIARGRSESSSLPPRRDLELEALAEILAGERLVHCHSYRQDEILMLCRVAADFGFKIGTFQHILEGYKVADEVGKHALGASCFTDWWAYKVEVQDAIPYAGPIMYEQGVLVSFNSDSDELARRMNWEAAKAVKYGRDLPPEEALKFVTLNPAKQLMIDDRVGSIEAGKDADLAIWSGPPLSAFSRCVATYVDGRRLFSLEDDAKHRETIAKERTRIIQKILALGGGGTRGGRPGGDGDGPAGRGPRQRPTDEVEWLREYYLDLINRGGDPDAARPGECGLIGQ